MVTVHDHMIKDQRNTKEDFWYQNESKQSAPQSAPVAFMIQHFDDLINSKDLVLVSGEFDPDVFSTRDAQLLYLQMGMYYGGKTSSTQLELLRRFNHDSERFQLGDVIEEFEALMTRLR